MKKSKYVTIAKSQKGDLVVYSALSGATLFVEKEKVPEFQMLYKGEIPGNHDPLIRASYESVLSAYKQALILLDDEFDELCFLEDKHNMAKMRSKYKHFCALTISPTMKCNLACPYCYNPQEDRKTMNTATRIDVTNFIRDNLLHQTDEPGKLRVTWVGGEPLYDIKVLSELAEQISCIAWIT